MTRHGTGLLVTLGTIAIAMAVVPWTRVMVAALVLGLGFIVFWLMRPQPRTAVPHWIDAITVGGIGTYLLYASRRDLYDWTNWQPSRRDYFFIWGARANLFLKHGGIDFGYLRHAPNDLAHPDYPWLWPLTIDWTEILFGGGIAVVSALFGVGLLLIIRELFETELGRPWGAAATLACVGIALPMNVGFAEGPYIAYSASGILLMRRHASPIAGLLLGFAALTKNEGLALIVAVTIAMALLRQSLRPLWPAFLMGGAWLVVRAWLRIPTDLFAGDVFGRIAHNIDRLTIFSGATFDQPWFFLALAIALAVAGTRLRHETFIIAVAALQLVFFIGAYLISPLDVAGHVVSSWGRLQAQLAIPLVFAALAAQHRPQ